jgi:hypothetical protein
MYHGKRQRIRKPSEKRTGRISLEKQKVFPLWATFDFERLLIG